VDEALIDEVGAGGGFIGLGLVTTQMSRSLPAIVELSFEIDFLVFEDGETAGPDSDPYAVELHCRKPAAEFIARQIRLAMAESRDLTPVLSALADIRCFGNLRRTQGDRLVQWTRPYAREYLHAMRGRMARLAGARPTAEIVPLEERYSASLPAPAENR
jgi:hypothetical protein